MPDVHAQSLEGRYEFHIEGGALGPVMEQIHQNTGIQLLFSYDLVEFEGVNAVNGQYTVQEAMEILLHDTGLTSGLTESGMIVITRESGADAQNREGEMTSRKVKKGLLASVSAFLFGAAPQVTAFAQADEAGGGDDVETIAESVANAGDQIIVTGSRLNQSNLTAASPVRVINADQIKLRGYTSVADTLAETPGVQIGEFSRDGTNSTNPGFQSVSLRGLGSERTLALINGRRQVSGEIGTSAVDLSTIPNSLVERVEVVTGGGSSIYGTDAVAGVVNLITKTDFEGIDLSTTYRFTDESDGETFQASIVAGTNFASGRGNITAAFEFSDDSPALAANRPFINDLQLPVFTPAGFASGLTRSAQTPNGVLLYTVPIFTTDLRSADQRLIIDDGSVTGTSGNFLAVSDDGQSIVPFNRGALLGNGFAQSGDGTPVSPINSDFIGADSERYIGSLYVNYDLTPNAEAFLEAKYVKRSTQRFEQPVDGIFGTTISNPFLPAGITPGLLAGQAPFVVMPPPGFPPFPPLPPLPNEVFVGKTFDGIGPVTFDEQTEVFTGAAGFKGKILDDLNWEVFFTYGRTELDERQLNNLNAANLALAANATTDMSGAIICADPNPMTPENEAVAAGCAPLNIFSLGEISPEALQFISPDLSSNTVQDQITTGFFVGGRAFDAPAGPVNFSVGYTFRKDTTDSQPSSDFQNGVALSPAGRRPVAGEISVHEGFVEVGVPILRDLPFAESIDITASASVANYSTVGTVGAYKFTGTWQMVEDIRFRGSYARAVRAPNINEAFPISSSLVQPFPQPCGPVGINFVAEDPATRAANCAADLGAANVPVLLPSPGILVDRGANPNLTEETSTTFTAGVVLQPRFADKLSITVDYYNVEILEAITTVDPFDIFSGCYDQSTFPGLTCGEFETDPMTNLVTSVAVRPINVDSLKTSGIDFGVNYFMDLSDIVGASRDYGSVGIAYAGLLDLEGIVFSLAQPNGEELVGVGARPKYEHTLGATYSYGPASLLTNWRFRGPSDMIVGGSGDFGSRSYFDMTLNYQLLEELDATFGVTNLTDKKPRLNDIGSAGIDDFLGRTFFIRLNASL